MSKNKLISALLIVALLLSPYALMEEAFENTEPESDYIEVEEAVEPVDEIVEEQSVDIVEEDTLGEDEGSFYSSESYNAAPSGEIFAAAGEVAINETNFPDTKFRSYIQSNVDTDGNGSLSEHEIAGVTSFTFSSTNEDEDFQSLTGIQFFTSIEEIKIASKLHLTALDLRGLNSLKSLDCYSCNLKTLDVSGLPNLKSLACVCCSLDTLDVSGDINLESLDCCINALSTLELSGLANLIELNCVENELTTLNINDSPKLEKLYCGGNKLTTIDIHNNPYLIAATTNKKSYCSLEDPEFVDGYHNMYSTFFLSDYNYFFSVDSDITIITGLSNYNTIQLIHIANKAKTTVNIGTSYRLYDEWEEGTHGYKSSNKKIATVKSNGVITLKSPGRVKITYKMDYGNKSKSMTLIVKDPTIPTKVTLNLKGTVAAKVGETQTLTATMSDGAVSKLKWTSSNKKIATVKNGVVTFKKKGTVTITVTTVKGNKKAKVKFKVSK